MPNYNITVTEGYKPYTFDEMIKPLVLYKAEFDTQMKAAETLQLEAAKRMQFLDPTLDKDKYDEYINTTNEINKLGEDIAANGLNANSLARANTIRRNFQTLVTPLDYALEQREKEKQLYTTIKLEHPELIISRDPFSTPVSSYFPGTKLSALSTINTKDAYDKAKALSTAFAKQFSKGDMRRLNALYYEYVTKRGIEGNPDDIIKQYPEFESIRNSILETMNFDGFTDAENVRKAVDAAILSGMKNGITEARTVSDGQAVVDQLGILREKARLKTGGRASGSSSTKSLSQLRDMLGISKDTGNLTKTYGVDDAVIKAKEEAQKLIIGPITSSDNFVANHPKIADWVYKNIGAVTNALPGDPVRGGEQMQDVIGSVISTARAFEPVYGKEEHFKKDEGNNTSTILDRKSNIVDYRLNLKNLPEREQEHFVKVFNTLGIDVKDGDSWKKIVKKLDDVLYRKETTIDENGNISTESVENNLNFGKAVMYDIKLQPSDIKAGIQNIIGEFQQGDKFNTGAVKMIDADGGAAGIDGAFARSLQFRNRPVSVKRIQEDLEKTMNPKMYYYENDKNKGIVLRLGGKNDYFIDLTQSEKGNIFTNVAKDNNFGRTAQDMDRGFSAGGTHYPYNSQEVLNQKSVIEALSEIDALKKAIEDVKTSPDYYSYSKKEKEDFITEANNKIERIKERPIFENAEDKGKIRDVIQAMYTAKAFTNNGNNITRAFADAYLSGFTGETYKQQPTVDQLNKYGYTGGDNSDILLGDLLEDIDIFND